MRAIESWSGNCLKVCRSFVDAVPGEWYACDRTVFAVTGKWEVEYGI